MPCAPGGNAVIHPPTCTQCEEQALRPSVVVFVRIASAASRSRSHSRTDVGDRKVDLDAKVSSTERCFRLFVAAL